MANVHVVYFGPREIRSYSNYRNCIVVVHADRVMLYCVSMKVGIPAVGSPLWV